MSNTIGNEEIPLLWLDLETTGLNPAADTILEVAVIITGAQGFEGSWVRRMVPNLAIWAPEVVAMHLANGLVSDCVSSKLALEDIETELLAKLSAPKYMLAGNTISFDKAFIEHCMPRLAEKLHYRTLDMSSVARFLAGLGFREFPKKKAHRAMDDIKESYMQYAHYINEVLK